MATLPLDGWCSELVEPLDTTTGISTAGVVVETVGVETHTVAVQTEAVLVINAVSKASEVLRRMKDALD